MPVKHGPRLAGKVTVDKGCVWPGCRKDALPGRLMCQEHEAETEQGVAAQQSKTGESP